MAGPVDVSDLQVGEGYMFSTKYIPEEAVTILNIQRIGQSVQTIVQSRKSDGITAHIKPRIDKPTYISMPKPKPKYISLSRGGKRQSRRRHRKRQTRRKSH